MSEVKVNKISPRTNCGTTQLGDAGDTITVSGDLKSNSLKPATGTTLTLGTSGDTVTLASGASQSGFGRSGSVDWQTTPKTATFTAASGEGYFINQSSAITMNLPAGSAGAIVAVSDYARNFATYNLTISPNGSEKIGGVAADLVLSVDGQAATFVYVDSTKGWVNVQNAEDTKTGAAPFIVATGGTITTCGDFKIHTFTGPGTFTVSQAAGSCCAAARNLVSYLVLAGGGGSGDAGAGAGGYREVVSPNSPYTGSPKNGYPTPGNRITVSAQAYPITVGGGGSATPQSSTSSFATNGSNSIFSTITSAGGGYGGNGSPGSGDPGVPTFYATGNSGGSGGGSGSPTTPNNTVSGGTGNTPPTTPPQGNNGGAGRWQPGSFGASGGGGGAGGAGNCYCSGEGVTGGPGTCSAITGSTVPRAAGGPAPTTANSGNGGRNAQAGQSGVVIIRYKFQ